MENSNKRYFEIEFFADGCGEFTYGVISDEKEIQLVTQLNEDDELAVENEGEIDGELVVVTHDEHDQIVHIYGLNKNDGLRERVVVREMRRNTEAFGGYEAIEGSETEYSIDDVNHIWITNPYQSIESIKEEHGENAIAMRGIRYDKKAYNSYLAETDGEDFDISRVFMKWENLDELFEFDYEILKGVMYATPAELKQWLVEKELLTGEDAEVDYDADGIAETFNGINYNINPDSNQDFSEDLDLPEHQQAEGRPNWTESALITE